MVPMGDHPILWHIMRHYRAYGVRDFVLCLGYKGEVIRDYFLNFRHNSADLEVDLSSGDVTFCPRKTWIGASGWSIPGMNTQTGARIRRIAQHIQSDRFFATYGDGLANIDLDELLRFHREQGKQITVTAVRPPSRFGELLVEARWSAFPGKAADRRGMDQRRIFRRRAIGAGRLS